MEQATKKAIVTMGKCLYKNEHVKKGVDTALKGTAGLGAIGIGTALETVGAGTIVGSAGSAITGLGCAATQTLMTGAATVLPGAIGTTAAGVIGSAASGVFVAAAAITPIAVGGAAIAGAICGIKKFVDWIRE